MTVEIFLGVLLIFGDHFGYADVHELELNNRQYLPALDNEENREYLQSPKADNNLNDFIIEENDNNLDVPSNYIHSQPQVLNDPLPERLPYNEPLKTGFFKERIPFKPLFNGALISGLFLPHIDVQPDDHAPNNSSINSKDQLKDYEESKEYRNFQLPFIPTIIIQKPMEIRSPLHTRVEYNQAATSAKQSITENSYEVKNNYFENPNDDIVPINYRNETTTEYKLFNYDEDDDDYGNDDDTIDLKSIASEEIYKPGDDISLIYDTSIIADYEHVFPSVLLKKLNSTSTTNLREYQELANNSTTTENDNSSHGGYLYERPKIPFKF